MVDNLVAKWNAYYTGCMVGVVDNLFNMFNKYK